MQKLTYVRCFRTMFLYIHYAHYMLHFPAMLPLLVLPLQCYHLLCSAAFHFPVVFVVCAFVTLNNKYLYLVSCMLVHSLSLNVTIIVWTE